MYFDPTPTAPILFPSTPATFKSSLCVVVVVVGFFFFSFLNPINAIRVAYMSVGEGVLQRYQQPTVSENLSSSPVRINWHAPHSGTGPQERLPHH